MDTNYEHECTYQDTDLAIGQGQGESTRVNRNYICVIYLLIL